MNVSYTGPLQQSWSRMMRMLFQPFRLEFWLTVGFAAFLANLTHGGGGGGGGKGFSFKGRPHVPFPEVARHVADFLLSPVWGPVVIAIAVCGIIFGLVLLWICSRGKFIFLDNVMRERAAIVEPWKRFARHGNALFVFWFAMVAVYGALFLMISLPLLPAFLMAIKGGGAWTALGVFAVSWWIAAMVPLAVVVWLTHVFLFDAVVPIMYRHDLGILAAWGRFFSLFRTNVLNFIAFGFVYLLLQILVATIILIVGFSTCCIGFLLVSFPYVGSVVMLPIEVTLRGFGPDFLEQFGPEWTIAPKPAPPAPAA